ncbi:transposase [Providencia alcalifaciens]|uniref:Transposase n=2 Tax=Morganellaceae TaxID=1903414 RepID=A0A4R3NEA9_9GAMM|nr:transposase [Providencia alcalifaciens]
MFIAGATARVAAELVGVNKNTATYYFHRLRVLIAEYINQHYGFDGEIVLDECYFGDSDNDQSERGEPVFALVKRGSKVYTKVISDAKCRSLQTAIESRIIPDSIVYTDNITCHAGRGVNYFKYYRLHHRLQFFDKKERQNCINGIDNFWGQVKRHMHKFNGIPKAHFELYLKECEWRFNTPNVKQQLTILKKMVKVKF